MWIPLQFRSGRVPCKCHFLHGSVWILNCPFFLFAMAYIVALSLFGYLCVRVHTCCNISRYWNCKCGHGYFGATCSRFDCARGCSYNGHCLDKNTCSCFRGFLGTSCEIDCGCGGHGQCNPQGGCICDVGWRHDGKTCVWSCAKQDSAEGCIGPGQSGCSEDCKFGTCVDGGCRLVSAVIRNICCSV